MANELLKNGNFIIHTTNAEPIKIENSNTSLNIKDERIYGIDLLRLLSMFFVVILHFII